MKLQIHIGGTKRSGKTTLANHILGELARQGLDPVLFDIDEIRRNLFGQADVAATIGSDANKNFHAAAHWYILKGLIPDALRANHTPIMVATHSDRKYYEAARALAFGENTVLKFLLLETPTLEEVMRRSSADKTSLSDTNNLSEDTAQMEAYKASTALFQMSYHGQSGNHIWIPQGSPKEMSATALRHILER